MPVGKIISTKVEKNRDGDKKVLMMQVEITDPDDIQDVEMMRLAGMDINPVSGSMCFIDQSGESWKIAVASDDGIEPSVSPGEYKIYSSKDGSIVASVYLKEDGTIAVVADNNITVDFINFIFNGGSNFAVRFNELETAFNKLKQDHDDLLAHYVDHIHIAPSGGGNTSIPQIPPPFPLPSTADIAPAKIDEIKVP